jgi:hypothetical protein
VRCSVPTCKDEAEALEITCRTAVHRLRDYVEHQGLNGDFVAFWSNSGRRVGAENDPKNLNVNWPTNVRQQWAKLGGSRLMAAAVLPFRAAQRVGKTALQWHVLRQEATRAGLPIECARCERPHGSRRRSAAALRHLHVPRPAGRARPAAARARLSRGGSMKTLAGFARSGRTARGS